VVLLQLHRISLTSGTLFQTPQLPQDLKKGKKTIAKEQHTRRAVLSWISGLEFTFWETGSKLYVTMEIMKSGYNVVITGTPGIGKSYFLCTICVQQNREAM